ncbi:MAG: alanine:cation symporter family protein [Firmicutes bacterium]|nr:alanine:cation symporter family protein [Bacillota bacterium]
MKSKKILIVALLGILIFGGIKAYAQISENKIVKNDLMTEKIDKQEINDNKEDKNNDVKKIAVKAIKNYLNEEVNKESLEARLIDLENEKAYLIRSDKYLVLLNNDKDKIIHLQRMYEEPKNDDYKNYPYDKAKIVATEFVNKNNIIGEEYTLLIDAGKELNENKDHGAYFFYFQYDGGKQCLITVNKDLKKVEQFILFDETNGSKARM